MRVAYTPGHASHHVSYFHEDSGWAFVGDVAGVRHPAGRPHADADPAARHRRRGLAGLARAGRVVVAADDRGHPLRRARGRRATLDDARSQLRRWAEAARDLDEDAFGERFHAALEAEIDDEAVLGAMFQAQRPAPRVRRARALLAQARRRAPPALSWLLSPVAPALLLAARGRVLPEQRAQACARALREDPPRAAPDPRAAALAYATLVELPRWGCLADNRLGHLLCERTRSSPSVPRIAFGLPPLRRAGPAQRSLLAPTRTTVPLVRPALAAITRRRAGRRAGGARSRVPAVLAG